MNNNKTKRTIKTKSDPLYYLLKENDHFFTYLSFTYVILFVMFYIAFLDKKSILYCFFYNKNERDNRSKCYIS